MPGTTDENSRPLSSYWEIVAGKLEREPALLEVARRNIARWRADGHRNSW